MYPSIEGLVCTGILVGFTFAVLVVRTIVELVSSGR